jgi:hypothetical protein
LLLGTISPTRSAAGDAGDKVSVISVLAVIALTSPFAQLSEPAA